MKHLACYSTWHFISPWAMAGFIERAGGMLAIH